MMFDKLPDCCLVCKSPFDRKSKEQAQTWFVVVREKEQVIRLFCPTCYNKAKDTIEEFYKKKEEQKNGNIQHNNSGNEGI